MTHQFLVEFQQRFVQLAQDFCCLLSNSNIDHSSIFVAAHTLHKLSLLKTVDQSRDAWNDSDRSTGNLQDWQRLSFASQDSQNVVLSRGQSVFAKQACKADLQLVIGSQQIQRRFLFERFKRATFFQFILQLRSSHQSFLAYAAHNIDTNYLFEAIGGSYCKVTGTDLNDGVRDRGSEVRGTRTLHSG